MHIPTGDLATPLAPAAARQADYLRMQLDSVPYSTALLDKDGVIVAVNGGWRRFARRNGADNATSDGVGLSYLEICRTSDEPVALAVCAGIHDVLTGRRTDFELVYPCHGCG